MSAIKGHPHAKTAKRIAQIEKWRLLGAGARRGQHTAARAAFHQKRAKRGTSVVSSYGKAAAWGIQKQILPVGIGGPIVALAKNRLPGYNQLQIVKATSHTATKGSKKAGKRRAKGR